MNSHNKENKIKKTICIDVESRLVLYRHFDHELKANFS